MSEVELDENALFDEAVSDEPANAVETAQPIKQEDLASSEETQATELTAEKPPIPPKPEWRIKEDAERARAAENDLANERAEKAALRQRLEALERQNQPAQKVEKTEDEPDPLLQPKEYREFIEKRIEERILNDRREFSLAAAHKTYKEEFEEAYAAAQQKINPGLKALMQQSRDPGETLIQWHREEKARAEVGTDLNAYKQRLREESLKDPEFRKTALEAWRADAEPQNNGRPRVSLPPSLNGTSRSNATLRSSQADMSDEDLWEETMA